MYSIHNRRASIALKIALALFCLGGCSGNGAKIEDDNICRAPGIQKLAFIDAQGTILNTAPYDPIDEFHDGYALVGAPKSAPVRNFIDAHGKALCSMPFAEADSFHDGMAKVSIPTRDGNHERFLFINENGKQLPVSL